MNTEENPGNAPTGDNNEVSMSEIENALRAQGGALTGDASAIAQVLHAGDCDTVESLDDTETEDVVELLRNADMTHTLRRAKRIVQALKQVAADRQRARLQVQVQVELQETVHGAVLSADAEEQQELEDEVVVQPGVVVTEPRPQSPTVTLGVDSGDSEAGL